jgi:hypothetical protein
MNVEGKQGRVGGWQAPPAHIRTVALTHTPRKNENRDPKKTAWGQGEMVGRTTSLATAAFHDPTRLPETCCYCHFEHMNPLPCMRSIPCWCHARWGVGCARVGWGRRHGGQTAWLVFWSFTPAACVSACVTAACRARVSPLNASLLQLRRACGSAARAGASAADPVLFVLDTSKVRGGCSGQSMATPVVTLHPVVACGERGAPLHRPALAACGTLRGWTWVRGQQLRCPPLSPLVTLCVCVVTLGCVACPTLPVRVRVVSSATDPLPRAPLCVARHQARR